LSGVTTEDELLPHLIYMSYRFEVLAAMNMSVFVFRVVMPCDLWVDTNVSKEHIASIFMAEVNMAAVFI
jgi:hypothetical protein